MEQFDDENGIAFWMRIDHDESRMRTTGRRRKRPSGGPILRNGQGPRGEQEREGKEKRKEREGREVAH